MKTTVSRYDFERAFAAADRKENFTYEGLELLFDYLEECDPDMELDVIAICCEYSEDHVDDIIQNYRIDIEGMDDDEIIEAAREYLEENTSLVGETAAGFVYAVF